MAIVVNHLKERGREKGKGRGGRVIGIFSIDVSFSVGLEVITIMSYRGEFIIRLKEVSKKTKQSGLNKTCILC